MIWRTRAARPLASLTLTGALLVALSGCRTTSDDLDRWARTAQGPTKLIAVVTHDKFSLDLRTEAALTLVEMKPRSGRRIGIKLLLEALTDMPADERAKVVTQMVPTLEEKIKLAPEPSKEGQPVPPDPATPYKDAAYAMLTHDDAVLVEDENARKRLKAALAQWVSTDFARRLDDSTQMYGVEQVARLLGSRGVAELPQQLKPNAKKIGELAKLIAELGDAKTKLAASKALVDIAQAVDSEKWKKQKAPAVEAANKASKLKPTKEQFEKQLDQYQEEEQMRVFQSMKDVGGKPIVDYLLEYASTDDKPEKRRATALAALENKVDKNDKGQVEKLLALASKDEVPDVVRGGALNRVGEMPRSLVVGKLFDLFGNDNWKIRWVSAELILNMSNADQLDEFMKKIGRVDDLAISEAIVYGQEIDKLKGVKTPADAQKLADQYAKSSYPVGVRATALAYYYTHGTKHDVDKVKPYLNDKTSTPEPDCGESTAGCEWACDVKKGKETESKDVETVGDFVQFCVLPAMEKRDKRPDEDGDEDEGEKKKGDEGKKK